MQGRPIPTGSRPRLGRREALLAGGGGVAALALGLAGSGCGDDEQEAPPREETPGELGIEGAALGRLLALERRAGGTFESGARFADEAEARRFTAFASQAAEHAVVLEDLIASAGGTPPAAPEVPESAFVRDAESATTASKQIARRLIDEYANAIEASPEPDRRRALTTMLANDAQHLVVLGGLRDAEALPGMPEEVGDGTDAPG
jgi:hypothetical protein